MKFRTEIRESLGSSVDNSERYTQGTIEIFRRRRRRQPEVGLKTSISQE